LCGYQRQIQIFKRTSAALPTNRTTPRNWRREGRVRNNESGNLLFHAVISKQFDLNPTRHQLAPNCPLFLFPMKEAVSPRYLKASNSGSDFLPLNKPKIEHIQP
jgi:hypothetical protein